MNQFVNRKWLQLCIDFKEVVVVRQCSHKPSTECHRSHSKVYWWVIGGKPSSLIMSLTLNKQTFHPDSLLLQVLMYAVLYCFTCILYSKILVVIGICILCLWDIQLTFDSYNMGYFESYHNDSHEIRNMLVLVA